MAVYRSPLGRARGLGSAKHGVGHFIGQRLSAVILVPLVLWALWSVLTLAGAGYYDAEIWLRSPVNATLLISLVAVGFFHMHEGMRVVIEDYIERAITKAGLLVLNVIVCGLGGALAVVCLLKVALGGA